MMAWLYVQRDHAIESLMYRKIVFAVFILFFLSDVPIDRFLCTYAFRIADAN